MSENTTFDTIILPRLFRELEDTRKSGVLRITADANEVKVIIQDGAVLYVTGNRPQARLGHLLQARGLLTPVQLTAALQVARRRHQALGQVLVQSKCVTADKLQGCIRQQARRIIFELFTWPRGTFQFLRARLNLEQMVVTRLKITPLILEATRRIDDESVWTQQIPDKDTIFEHAPASAGCQTELMTTAELRLYHLVDGLRTFQELICDSGLEPHEAYRALYPLVAVAWLVPSRLKIYQNKHEKAAVSVIFKGYNQAPGA